MPKSKPNAAKRPLTVEDALARVLDGVAPMAETRTLDLLAAHGAVLASPVIAQHAQPPFPASAMDGYAVRAADVATLPATLRVVGEAAAGHGFGGTLAPGSAVRIFTGAPIPQGADAIVIQEDTRASDGHVSVLSGTPDRDHIRPRAGDFDSGQALLTPGLRLTARHLTLAAAAGHASLVVRRAPRVAILATGDELVPPGTPPARDQIVCSNPYGVAAMVRAAGGEPHVLGIARDTRASLDAKIAEAGDADILVTLGGASVGDHDLVGPALAARGMALDFWKIAMRPGKPMMFGRLGAQRVLGLPGNPVSSLITARLFLMPLIAALRGEVTPPHAAHKAPLAVPLPVNGPRAHYMRAVWTLGPDGAPAVTPLPNQDSSLLTPLAEATLLILRPIGAPAAPVGMMVEILPLDF
jgi:molybdopterin molybdotransferase